MSEDREHRYWYNLKSGEVEHGLLSPSSERVGPFDTAEEASRALETLRENSERWAAEEAEED